MYRLIESNSEWFWTHQTLYDQLAKYLERRGVEVTRERAEHWEVRNGLFSRRKPWEIRAECAIVSDERTGEYAVMDCADHLGDHDPRLTPILSDSRCRLYLKAQYRRADCHRPPFDKVRPWIYFPLWPLYVARLADYYRCVTRHRMKLHFRGKTDYANREEILASMRPAGVLSTAAEWIPQNLHLAEMSEHRLALALPGHGNLCHRQFEAFAIGTPVLMPVLRNTLHDSLIPDRHYVSVDVDTSSAPAEEIASRLCERYFEVIDDQPLLDAIRQEASAWYDRNSRFPASLELTGQLLGLLEPNKTS